MKILHLCLGLYNFWTTYEGEYFNESLMARPDVDLKMWGRDRILYKKNMSATDVVKRLYGNEYPDVIIVHSSMQKHEDANDRKLFEGLDKLRNHSIIVWRTFDCFGNKMKFYANQIKTYKPQFVLIWYPDQARNLKKVVGSISKVCYFPHSVGRRYHNRNSARKYDLAIIGRCENNEELLSPGSFKNLKVYKPPPREGRPKKGNNLVFDLNLAKFSWNSPVKKEGVSLRFVEAPACGTVSMVPHHFEQLDYYFPKDCYVVCDSSTKKSQRIITNMSKEEYADIQSRAYKVVINNHTMDCRVAYLLDLLRGKKVEPREYYGVEW